METENRLATAGLNQQLQDVRSYSFFQLANLLRRYADLHNAVEDSPVLVRYRALASLAFPAADVEHCEVHPARHRQFLDVTVTFMGLFGPASPLPAFYTERVIQAQDQQSPSRDLMDMFNHRCITLLQQCWEKYRYYSQYAPNGSDLYSGWLVSLLGVDTQTLMQATPLRWHKLLPFAGVLSNNVCSMDSLARMLKQYFDLPVVKVKPWVYREVPVPGDQRTRVGMTGSALGEDIVLGDTVGDFSGKFALCLSGLSRDQYSGLLPGGEYYSELVALVRFLLKDALAFDLHLACDENVSAGGLLGDDECRLGWHFRLGDQLALDSQESSVICVDDFQNF